MNHVSCAIFDMACVRLINAKCSVSDDDSDGEDKKTNSCKLVWEVSVDFSVRFQEY